MKIAYIECLAGASLDKFLGAWFDLGLEEDNWRCYMNFFLEGVAIRIIDVSLKGVSAKKAIIDTNAEPYFLSFSELQRIIENCLLPPVVKEKTMEVFHHLLAVKATSDVAITEEAETITNEAIIYVVGNALAWHLLGEPACFVSTIQMGGGVVERPNGTVIVPTSSTIQLLLEFPTYSAGLWGETIDSTAAAFIRTFMRSLPQTPFIAEKVGHGAGNQNLPVADIVRIQLGKWSMEKEILQLPTVHSPKQTVVIETNIDDMNPEWAGHLVERLVALGAMDAYWTPVIMKKGRPGLQLRVACSYEKQQNIQEEIARQTTTIGMRIYEVGKWSVPRRFVTVETPYGKIPVKIAYLGDEIVNVAPEYEECRKLADTFHVPVKVVYQTALSIAIQKYQGALKQ
ncbi:LarC family nickel insertion protein [Fodinisporobacter ferrooxydans]|uniref:LarC family nickel insertion protein n=1 Tax=Fodinisporobacter ferrooxydans TaxID=2901836 RepID=A0ABY4CT60_9BACL|nr:LarC family nickel insertion protein [Alicyclobacillaceae bacterium MYW30-H2]